MNNQQPPDILLRRYRQFFALVGIFSAITLGFYLYIYFDTGISQALIVPGLMLLLVILAPLLYWMVKRERNLLAGVTMLTALGVVYAGNEATWTGLTSFHLVGGVFLILLAGSFLLPRRIPIWLVIAGFYVLLILIIGRVDAAELNISRISYETVPFMLPFSIGATLVLALAFLIQLLNELQAGSLRTRILASIAVLVVTPVIILGIAIAWFSARSAESRVLNTLETVTALKEAEVNTWLDSLDDEMSFIAPSTGDLWLYESVLSTDAAIGETAARNLLAKYNRRIQTSGLFKEYLVLDINGRVVISTNNDSIGMDESGAPYFKPGLEQFTRSTLYDSLNYYEISLAVATPIVTTQGKTIGVFVGRADLNRLERLMSIRSGLGATGETYLVSEKGTLLTPSVFGAYPVGSVISSASINRMLAAGAVGDTIRGSGVYFGYRLTRVVGYYRWLPGLKAGLLAEQEQVEALRSTYQLILYTVILAILAVSLALVAGVFVSNLIINPIANLARTAERIAAGEIELQAHAAQKDEIGNLAASFNAMTSQLRGLVTGLEQRVAERTAEADNRSRQLQIAAEVARDATGSRELEDVLNSGANLVKERFGYYYAGLFLVDNRGEYAVLSAATGEAGRQLIARNHRLKVGERGMVGYVCQTGLQRVALDVTSDPTHYVNPLLPDTQAEAVLPLKVGPRVIGALDVQSTDKNAFTSDVVAVMQIVADQLAVAIENARLLRQARETLTELQTVYGTYTRESWRTAQQRLFGVVGYRYGGIMVEPIRSAKVGDSGDDDSVSAPVDDAAPVGVEQSQSEQHTLLIPLRLRDQDIGSLEFQFEEELPPPETIGIYEEIANRMTLLLENARLLQDAQNLASREQQINQIANQVRSSINLDAILQSTVREIGLAFGASRTFIQLTPSFSARQSPSPMAQPAEPGRE